MTFRRKSRSHGWSQAGHKRRAVGVSGCPGSPRNGIVPVGRRMRCWTLSRLLRVHCDAGDVALLADVYVLATERTAAMARSFLDCFLPDRVAAANEYPLPEYADPPERVFTDSADVIEWCASRPAESYAVYWLNARPASEPHSAHVFFLTDGGMVLGLSTRRDGAGEPEELLRRLQSFAGSRFGYWTYEHPPVGSTAEFRRSAGVE
jgi:hypothetical protein